MDNVKRPNTRLHCFEYFLRLILPPMATVLSPSKGSPQTSALNPTAQGSRGLYWFFFFLPADLET